MSTLDDQLREALQKAKNLLDEIESRRPVEARTNPMCEMSKRVGGCRVYIKNAIDWAEEIR